jgi:hypothetical protein
VARGFHPLLVACVVSAVGCAHAGEDPWRRRPRYLGDGRIEPGSDGSYAPPPAAAGDTRQGVLSLQSGGAQVQVRATALRFVKALVEIDAVALAELLPARVVLTIDGTQAPRDELIERCLKDTRALVYATQHDPALLIDLDEMVIERADLHARSVPLPAGIDGTDWSVTLPPRDALDEPARRVPCITTLYIRTGPRHQIVGIAR